ncbi:uncharacterized protein LOC110697523 isoform X1 [Chenopodium quinoa]|uniref:uncharacterized protein LOC110695832 isoform X1 n=1 Tax=Chenopodium quinoa TaxID=63459 RepID=UPI000B77DFCA|nr:uncharacterized protein LOC110695832 isoform X1 [Chenopodium quinoa]XP_021730583.1 uncharacterized protein LOC110697523 isoform X1 [Chenopodium quinoa]
MCYCSGPNGAIIHYKPEPDSCSIVDPEKLFLLDSGAQYIDGTTDITRTVHFGETTSREKECFTRVLQHSTSERHQHSTTEAHQYRNTEDHAAEPSKHSSLTSKQHSTTAEQQTPSTTTEQNRNTAAQALKPVTQSA